jgi:RNA polymerase sigma-54 factor
MSGMQLNMNLGQRLEQRMILAPRMIQSMEILQLPIMDLEARVRQELEDNFALEEREPAAEVPAPDEAGPADFADARVDPDGELVINDNAELDFQRLEALARDYGEAFNEEHRPSRAGVDEEGDRKHDAMSNTPSRPQSLQDYLAEQLGFLDLSPDVADLVNFLISHVDGDGFLRITDAEIASSYPQPVTPELIEEAIDILQHLDPPGVGARSREECLLLQVHSDTPYVEIVRTLIQRHLEDVAFNRLPLIQKKTGFDLAQIKAAIEVLRHLNPKPGAQFSAENIPYVVPDVIVERTENGDYEVRLADDWLPDVHIPRHVIEMVRNRSADPKDREYIRRKIQSAQWLVEAIEQRRSTLEKVTRAIVRHQRAFLDKGPEHIEPLKMQQIADQVGVHVTTVSRAVDDKWVQTPRGIFPLKRFFGGGTQTATGEEVAWETIKNKLLELIDKEDKSNPLSDEEIVQRLADAGYPVARRTVTKYRKMLRIPSSRQRRDWTLTNHHSPPHAAPEPPHGAAHEAPPGAAHDPSLRAE